MEINLKFEKKNIKVDFVIENTIQCSDIFLIIYDKDCGNWMIRDEQKDYRTDDYHELHFSKIQQIAFGHFEYKNEIQKGQIGFYFDSFMQSFSYFFINPFSSGFRNSTELYYNGKDVKFIILDLKDFNQIRDMIGLPNFSLKEYIVRLINRSLNTWDDKFQFELRDESKLFCVNNNDELDLEDDFITINGFSVFLEEQDKKHLK